MFSFSFFLRSRKMTSTEPNAIVTCAVVQLRQSTSRESNEIMIYSLSCFQINEGNPHQDQSHCHLLLILSTARPSYLILSYLILSYFILPPSYPLFCASFLSYLILSHLLLILSTAPAEEPLGHQHQQEERSH